MNTALRRQDDKQIEELESRFDRHLEIYANNGRELSRLSKLIEIHIKDHDEFKKKIEPMIKFYEGMTFTQRMVMYMLALLASIGGLYIIIKQIFK